MSSPPIYFPYTTDIVSLTKEEVQVKRKLRLKFQEEGESPGDRRVREEPVRVQFALHSEGVVESCSVPLVMRTTALNSIRR